MKTYTPVINNLMNQVAGLVAETQNAERTATVASLGGKAEVALAAANKAFSCYQEIQSSIENKRIKRGDVPPQFFDQLRVAESAMSNALKKADTDWKNRQDKVTTPKDESNPIQAALAKLKKVKAPVFYGETRAELTRATTTALPLMRAQQGAIDFVVWMHGLGAVALHPFMQALPEVQRNFILLRMAQNIDLEPRADQTLDFVASKDDFSDEPMNPLARQHITNLFLPFVSQAFVSPSVANRIVSTSRSPLAISLVGEEGQETMQSVQDMVARDGLTPVEALGLLPDTQEQLSDYVLRQRATEVKPIADAAKFLEEVSFAAGEAQAAQIIAVQTGSPERRKPFIDRAIQAVQTIHDLKASFTGKLSDGQAKLFQQLVQEAEEARYSAVKCDDTLTVSDVETESDDSGYSEAKHELEGALDKSESDSQINDYIEQAEALKNKTTVAEFNAVAAASNKIIALGYAQEAQKHNVELHNLRDKFFSEAGGRYPEVMAKLNGYLKKSNTAVKNAFKFTDEDAPSIPTSSPKRRQKTKKATATSKGEALSAPSPVSERVDQDGVVKVSTKKLDQGGTSLALVPLSKGQSSGEQQQKMMRRVKHLLFTLPTELYFNGARVMWIQSDSIEKAVSGDQLALKIVPYSTAVTLRFPRDDVIGAITPTGVGNAHDSRIGAKVLCAGAALGALYLVVTGYQYAYGEADESGLGGAPYLALPASNSTVGYELGEYGNGVVPFVGGDSFDQGKMLGGAVTALTAAAAPVLRQTATIVNSTVSNLIEKTGLPETATRIGSGLWGVWKSKAPTWLGGQSTPVITDKTRLIAPPETAGVAEINPIVVSSPTDVYEQIQLMSETVTPDVRLALTSAAASSELLARLNTSVAQPSDQLPLYRQPFDFSPSNITGSSVEGECDADSANNFSQAALDSAKNVGASVWRQLPSMSLPKVSLPAIDPRAMLARASQAAIPETVNKSSVVSSRFSLARRPVAKAAENITWAINLGRDGIYASSEGVQGLIIRLTGALGSGGFVDKGIQAVMPQQSDLSAINITDGVGQHPQVKEIDDVEIAPNATDTGGVEEEIDVDTATHAEEQQSRFRQWQQWAYTSFTWENIERLNRDGALPGLYQLFMHNASSLGATGREILKSGVETAQSTWGLGAAGLAALFYMMRGKSQANFEVQAEDEEVEGEQKLPGRKGSLFSSVLPINSFRDNVKQSVQWLKAEYKDSSSDDIYKYAHAYDVANIDFKDDDKTDQKATLSDALGVVGRKQLSEAGDNNVRFTLDKGSVSDQYQRFLLIAKVVAEECKSRGRNLKDEVTLGNVQPPSAREECRQAFAECGFQDIKFEEKVTEEAGAPHVASAGF